MSQDKPSSIAELLNSIKIQQREEHLRFQQMREVMRFFRKFPDIDNMWISISIWSAVYSALMK